MSKKLDLLIPEEQRPQPPSSPAQPSYTLSYTAWNEAQGSTVNWRDFEEVTSGVPRDTGKHPMDLNDEENESGEEYSGDDDDGDEEDSE